MCVGGGAREQARFHPASAQYSLSRSRGIRRGSPRTSIHLSLWTGCQLSLPQQSPILTASSWSTCPLMVAPGAMLSSQVVVHFLLPQETGPAAVLWLGCWTGRSVLSNDLPPGAGDTEERLWLLPHQSFPRGFRRMLRIAR